MTDLFHTNRVRNPAPLGRGDPEGVGGAVEPTPPTAVTLSTPVTLSAALTPYAPGVGPADPLDPAGWTAFATPAGHALRLLVHRLALRPGRVLALAKAPGEIDVVDRQAPHLPLAILWDSPFTADSFNGLAAACGL